MASSHIKPFPTRHTKKSTIPKQRRRKVRKKAKSEQLPIVRLLIVWLVLVIGLVGLGYRLYQLQVVEAGAYQSKAKAQKTTALQPYVPRRPIIDSMGNVLATDRLMFTLFVHPKYFKPTEAIPDPANYVATQLSKILGDVTPEELLERFQKKESGIKLATNLSESQAVKINGINVGGVDLEKDYGRYYPQNEMVAEIVGYVDNAHQGQAGVELSQSEILERDALSFAIQRNGQGRILPTSLPKDLLQSNDWRLQLTIDLRLQQAARELLRAQVQRYQAKRGTLMIMDAQDGAIVAMVNEPTYNPNEYFKADVEYFKNWAVSDLYEPGSTFKPVNVALALNDKAVKVADRVSDPGSVQVGPWTISNASKRGAGMTSITEVIRQSSNVGMVAIIRRLKPARYYELMQGIGLDSKTGIDLPGEVANYLKDRKEFINQPIEPATASFGQGFSITPIKLLQLHSAIANGGRLVTPHVVKGLVDTHDHLHWQPDYPEKRVFSEADALAVVDMMETVVDGGTGKAAYIKDYRIGGKTGTAQKAAPRGGYLANAKITSFVSILPVEAPRYVVTCIVDEPKGGNTYGGTVAAPVVKKIMETLIALKGIPPSGS